jgi:hypothetical protein
VQERYLSNNVASQHAEAVNQLRAKDDELADVGRRRDAAARERPLWHRLLRRESARQRELEAWIAQLEIERHELWVRVAELATGLEGEEAIPERYRSSLSDDWIIYHGFRNPTEVDHVMVGPLGIWAIEVKNQKVRLEVDGQDWIKQNLSNAGFGYEEAPATDRGGRPWGRQASDPASALGRRLAAKGHPIRIRTAVVLVNEGAQIGSIRDPGVDLVTADLGDVDKAIGTLTTDLTAADIAAIDEIIIEQHRHFEERRKGKGKGKGKGRSR